MVSIKDIASACSVSIATVSKALNNHKDVSESTKNLIRETAKKMGYLPNTQARALKTNRTYNLGVLFAERAQSGLTHSYFAAVLNAFKNEAESYGYDLTFISHNIGDNNLTYYEHCICRNVDGVVVACVDDYQDAGVKELLESSVPTVTIDYQSPNKPAIVSNNYFGMRNLVEYIYKKGHRKIAYIYGDLANVTTTRLKSFEDTLNEFGVEVRSDYLLQGHYHDPKSTEKLAASLVQLADPPTCIIVSDDFSAVGAYNAFEKLGLAIPNDISIAGFDGIVLSQVLHPKLTTFKQDTDRIGSEAAKQLIALIKKEINSDIEPIVIDGYMLNGASVKDLNE